MTLFWQVELEVLVQYPGKDVKWAGLGCWHSLGVVGIWMAFRATTLAEIIWRGNGEGPLGPVLLGDRSGKQEESAQEAEK